MAFGASIAAFGVLHLAMPTDSDGSESRRLPRYAVKPQHVASSPDTTAPRTLDELLARLKHVLDSSGTPGASLAIVRRDTVLFVGGLGLARVTPALPATRATLFRIGSTAKIFVGLTALALEREGRLSLQQPLRTALPGYVIRNPWSETDTIRLVHLMEHTSGIDDNTIKAYASSDPKPISLADGLAIDAGRQIARWRPGTRFAYSNTGPALVARVIELTEGKPFEAIVQRRWFDRLGMRTATYFEPRRDSSLLASLYLPGKSAPVPYWHPFARPIGSLNASAEDMAALLRLLTSRGVLGRDTLITAELLSRAERSETWIGARVGITAGGYGLGLYSSEGEDGRLWAGHSGGVEGGLSDLSYLPDEGVGYSLQINAMRGRALGQMSALVRSYLTQSMAPPVSPAPARLSASIDREFTGWYRPVSPRPQLITAFERLIGLVRVHRAGERLRVVPLIGNATSFVPVDSLTFRTERGSTATLAFHRDAGADLRPTMEGFNSATTYTRLSAAHVAVTFASAVAWALAFVLGPLIALILATRWMVRYVRGRAAARDIGTSPAPPLMGAWACAAGASASVVLFCWCALSGFQDIRRFGSVSTLSISVAVAPFLYIGFTALGLVLVGRTMKRGTSRGAKAARALAYGAFLAHAAGALYATRYGLVGFVPWL